MIDHEFHVYYILRAKKKCFLLNLSNLIASFMITFFY